MTSNIRGEEVKLGHVFTIDRTHTKDNSLAVYTCKKCDAAWSCAVDPTTETVDLGTANALLAHARAHETTPRMRRL